MHSMLAYSYIYIYRVCLNCCWQHFSRDAAGAIFSRVMSKQQIQTIRCLIYIKMCLETILYFLEFFYYLLRWFESCCFFMVQNFNKNSDFQTILINSKKILKNVKFISKHILIQIKHLTVRIGCLDFENQKIKSFVSEARNKHFEISQSLLLLSSGPIC